MKKVSVVDTATQTDPINILDSAVQSSSTNSQTEDLQKQKGQTNTTNTNQTKTPTEEKKGEAGLKKATIEMIRKDWKKQQQKERQARSQSSPPTKQQTKSKSSQGTQRPSTSNRERKGSNNVIQQHNKFGSLSDSSDDMELGEAPDRPRNRSRSSEHSHVNNYRSKSPITYP